MVEETLPLWFRAFEPIAVLIAIIAIVFMINTWKKFEGGLKKGYGTIILGTGVIALSMVWKFIVEAGLVVEGLMSEVILELFIIIGIIIIAFGSKKISSIINKINKKL